MSLWIKSYILTDASFISFYIKLFVIVLWFYHKRNCALKQLDLKKNFTNIPIYRRKLNVLHPHTKLKQPIWYSILVTDKLSSYARTRGVNNNHNTEHGFSALLVSWASLFPNWSGRGLQLTNDRAKRLRKWWKFNRRGNQD